jgi:hypothetical protein
MMAPIECVALSDELDELRRIRGPLKAFCDEVIRVYHESGDAMRRRAVARTACSVGRFAELITACVSNDAASGTSREIDELMSYLSPYWMHQNRRVIERAEATLAVNRRLPDEVANSALAKLLGHKPVVWPAH